MSLLKLFKAKYLHVGDIVLPYDEVEDAFINRPFCVYCITDTCVYVRNMFEDSVMYISKVKNVLKYV